MIPDKAILSAPPLSPPGEGWSRCGRSSLWCRSRRRSADAVADYINDTALTGDPNSSNVGDVKRTKQRRQVEEAAKANKFSSDGLLERVTAIVWQCDIGVVEVRSTRHQALQTSRTCNRNGRHRRPQYHKDRHHQHLSSPISFPQINSPP